MGTIRRAHVVWEGTLASGSGKVGAASQAFKELPVSWTARSENPDNQTSPEEMLAAAHATCFAMALSAELAKMHLEPEKLEVDAEVAFEKLEEGWRVTTSHLSVRGKVPGADADRFVKAAEAAKEGCPISLALRGNVKIALEAALE
ncbi:MAG TPA: osmotically inducible protein OsmC [Cyanobacteria bacterium UBA8530]|nr:osmotically inducible protein OsmC [Cyanobacteria bacterium UBA8530]